MLSRLKLAQLKYVGPSLGAYVIDTFGFRGLRLCLAPMADGKLENVLKPQDVSIDPVSGSKSTQPLVSINASGLNGGPCFTTDVVGTALMLDSDVRVMFGNRGFATNVSIADENNLSCNAPTAPSASTVKVYVCTKNGFGTTSFTYT